MDSLQPSRGWHAWLLRRWPQLWALALIAPAAFAVTSMSMTMGAAAIVVSIGLPTITALAMTADDIRALRVPLPAAVRFGVCAAVTGLGFGGLFAFSSSLAWVAIAGYVATAAWDQASRNTPPSAAVVAPHESEEPTAALHLATTDEVRTMTDAELCQAWRRSFAALMSTHNVGQRAGVVSLRQVLLDEMEARHPAGLQAWLRSGARAAGGPDQFFGRSQEGGTTQAA